jgi:hypothetical protein
MRKDCSLSNLTEEQLADLFDWLSTGALDAVKQRVAKPPPDGFGIKTHTTTLARFYRQRHSEIRNRDLAEALASAPTVEKCKPFIDSARRNHAHATFTLTNTPLSATNYRAVSTTLFQHDDLELRRGFLEVARENVAISRERLEFDRTQFEYNAARAALSLHVELAAIHSLTDIDDEEKIWRVRQRLFGTPPPVVQAGTADGAPQMGDAGSNLAGQNNSGGAM